MPVSARCTPTLPRKLIHSLFDFFLFVRHHAERLSLDSIGFARTANDLLLDGTMGVARKFLIFHGLTIVFHQWSCLVRFMTLETPLDERDISNWRRSRQGRLSMPRTRLPFVVVTVVLTFVVLEGPFAQAEGQTLPPQTTAALVLQQHGTYDLGSRVVRCQAGQKVGIWVESHSITIANAIIEGCDVGIAVIAKTFTDSGSTTTITHVTGARVSGALVGLFLAGSFGTVSENIVGGARYG